jgi:hypothetical protein
MCSEKADRIIIAILICLIKRYDYWLSGVLIQPIIAAYLFLNSQRWALPYKDLNLYWV